MINWKKVLLGVILTFVLMAAVFVIAVLGTVAQELILPVIVIVTLSVCGYIIADFYYHYR